MKTLLRILFPAVRRTGLAVVVLGAAASPAAAANLIRWDLLSVPATAVGGSEITLTAVVTNLGDATWGGAHYLVMRDAADTPVAMTSLSGIQPGETRTLQLRHGLASTPGVLAFRYQALEHEIEWFGETLQRVVTVSAPPPYLGMQLSATTFDRLDPSRLSTTDAVVQAPPFRLRAKVIDGTAWGWHAANTWNTNGRPLDNPPFAGSYATCSLYWVRYAALFGNVLEIGPERLVSLTVTAPVTLTSNWFHASSPPLIFTGESIAGAAAYRLFATFRNAFGMRWETSDGLNNHQRPLTNLPPPGEYEVDLYWRKYDSSLRLVAAGPVRTVTVRVTEGPLPRLQAAGQIFGHEVYDEVEDANHTEYSSDYHRLSVAVAGVLRVRATASTGGEMYLNVFAADGAPLRSGGRELEVPVEPGEHVVQVTSGHEAAYGVSALLYPYAAKPVLTSPAAARGGAGAVFPGYTITATGGGPLRFGAPDPGGENGLPAGLAVDPVSGAVTGTPTTPGTYPVWVTAANAAGSSGQWVLFTIFQRPEPVLPIAGVTGPDSGVVALDWSGRLPTAAVAPNPGDPAPTGPVTYTAERLAPGATIPETLAVPGGLPKSITAHYGELRLTASYAGDANYAAATKTVRFAVPDTQPPIAPANLVFQAGVITPTGFSVAWNAFTDAAGIPGGWPSHGISYEASLDGGAQTRVGAAQGAAFNGLAPGSTHTLRLRARDLFGNWSPWQGTTFTVTLPATESDPGLASSWADINGDGIRDELVPAGGRFSVFAAEEKTETHTYTNWTWEFVPQLGVSLRDGWNLFAGGSWQLVPEDVTCQVELMRPGFQFHAEPGYDYTVVWSTQGPPPGNVPRRVPFFPPAEYVPAGGSGGAVLQEVLAGGMIPAEAFHFFPTQLVRLGKPLGAVRLGGFAAATGATAAAAGTLPAVLGVGGTTISVTDTVGNLLKAGSRVAWEVWDGVRRIAGGTALGGMIDLGVNSAGRFQVGLRLDDSTTCWFSLEVAPPPAGHLAGPSHLWINDDDDAGATGGSDVPGSSRPNFADDGADDGRVNGVRDLVDFFPVTLAIREFLAAYPPAAGARYRLRQADGALNFVYTNLAPAAADTYHRRLYTTGFGPRFDQPAGEAATHRITAAGTVLAGEFLRRIAEGGDGVILVEGRAESTRPLVLAIERPDGAEAARLELPLRISPVERMFRHLNLRGVATEYEGGPRLPSDLGPEDRRGDRAPDWPDALTNGRYFVFVHGYNVSADRGRGWGAEVFKRLHQLGSRARFVAVSWYGSTGLDYHRAVFHAFQTGDVLAARLAAAGIAGDITVAAHSLGNLVVSQAIQDGGLASSRFYMLNAAVPLEAYDDSPATVPEQQRRDMTESRWTGQPSDTFAANWHQLFRGNPSDARNQLTWKKRFARAAAVGYNFFSPGEDVAAAPESQSPSLVRTLFRQGGDLGRGAWAMQELAKGLNIFQSLSVAFFDRTQGGWGQSSKYWPGTAPSPDPKREPYFDYFLERSLFHADAAVASATAARKVVQHDLLARGIPAMSHAAAANPLQYLVDRQRSINLETAGRDPAIWPVEGHDADDRSRGRWLHSDFKNVALPYVSPLYQTMITLGSLP